MRVPSTEPIANHRISVSVTNAEYQKLRQRAFEAGVSVSKFIRKSLTDRSHNEEARRAS